MKRLDPVCALCRLLLLAAVLMLAVPAVGWGAQGAPPAAASCNPFCGVLRFMAPPSRAAVQHARLAARPRAVHVAHVLPVRSFHPHPVTVAARQPPPAYPRIIYPHGRVWQAVYPGYAYPGYGYVYYYVYSYGWRAY